MCFTKITSSNLVLHYKKKELLGCGNRVWSGVSSTAPSLRDKNHNWTIIRHGPFIEITGKKLCQLMSIMSHSIQESVSLNCITLIICNYRERT